MTDGPLVSLDKLSEPVTKLVEVIAAGIGKLYEPIGVVRLAKAESKASIIRALSDGKIATMQQRVASRLEHRESMRQENIERVASVAASELPAQVSREPVDRDWTTQFFDHAQDVSDADLQVLWGRILAGEVASPGTYSRRTLEFLRTLDKWEAEAFSQFCGLALADANGWYFFFHNDAYYEALRARFENRGMESHFAAIGLLLTDTGMPDPSALNGRRFSYFGSQYRMIGPPKPDPSSGLRAIEIGPTSRNFSMTGQQLAKISGASPLEGYVEKVSVALEKKYGVRFEKLTS